MQIAFACRRLSVTVNTLRRVWHASDAQQEFVFEAHPTRLHLPAL